MTTTTTTPTDLVRVSQLATQMYGIVRPFADAATTNAEAKAASDGAREDEVNVREGIVAALAEFSQLHQLTANEAAAVASKAASGHNNLDTKKAMDTFIGECRVALHPDVRSRVPALIATRTACWDNEKFTKDADKDAPTPLRNTFKRKYHMLLRMMNVTAKGKVPLDTAEDVLRWADDVAEEQRTDVPKMVKKLEKLAAELRAFHTDFPVDNVQVAIEALAEVDAKALKMARAQITAAAAGNVVAMPKAAPVVTPPVAEVIPTVVDESESPVDGAYDLEADLLGETAELVAA